MLCQFSQEHALPFLTLLNLGSQEAECRKYGWDGRDGRDGSLDRSSCPTVFLSSDALRWGSLGTHSVCPGVQKGLHLTGHRPAAHSISQAFGPQDLFPSGTLHALEDVFRNYISHSLSRPKVTRVAGRPLHAFVLLPVPRVLGSLSSLESISTGDGLQRLPCGSPTGNPSLFKSESSRINREINWGK